VQPQLKVPVCILAGCAKGTLFLQICAVLRAVAPAGSNTITKMQHSQELVGTGARWHLLQTQCCHLAKDCNSAVWHVNGALATTHAQLTRMPCQNS
jgi:hypothetical protein